MGFEHFYRFSVHAVIQNQDGLVLLIKQTYGDKRWGLPGGSVEPGETIHQAVSRECKEELGVDVEVVTCTGFYYHSSFDAQVGIFLCRLPQGAQFCLSSEHSEYGWFQVSDLSETQQLRVKDALEYNGSCVSRAF
ncbi:MAG: NUDIX domain-containing protein [Chloroflexota bacterium]|nr:NUDIX domain-containing protein [Chloroflexota bacterium]